MLGPLLAFAAACHDLEAVPPVAYDPTGAVVPTVTLPVPSGPHRVGRRLEVWYDAGRDRSIPVWVYYPAWVADTTREPLLADSTWAILHRQEIARVIGDGPATALWQAGTTAHSDAPIEPWARPFPVLLFAPARGWLPTDYSALLEEVVSRGYVVVAFAPPGDAAIVRLPDGKVMPVTVASEASHERTVGDFRFIARTLRDHLRDHTSPYFGMLDLSRLGILGHGLGGTAAFLAVARDTTFRAAASLDGDFLGSVASDQVLPPLLYLSTQPPGLDTAPVDRWDALDRAERRHSEMWSAIRADARFSLRARVIGMESGNFLDAALMPPAVTQQLQGRAAFGAIDGARGIALTAGLLDRFFGGIFSGARASTLVALNDFPEARLSY